MNEVLTLVMSILVGALLGSIFFGGLCWTVNRALSTSKQPAMLFAGSMLLRTVIAIMGFYFVVARWGWRQFLICLVGFVLARLFVTRLTRVSMDADAPSIEGSGA